MSAPARPASLKAYGVAAALIEPFAGRFLRGRVRRGKEDPTRLGERLGRASMSRPDGPLIWLHAVSVGESVSMLPLIARLGAERPDHAILVTSGTRTSAELLAGRLPKGVIHQYAPIDAPGPVAAFLDHWRPTIGVFVESELWPNLILGAHARGTRLALVSARMTERSARSWRRWPGAVRAVLSAFDLVLPQDGETEQRLTSLGARIDGRLNLKRIGAPPAADPAEVERLKSAIGERGVVLALSTHAGEETLIAGAVQTLAPAPLLIVVPRHRERGGDVVRELPGRRLARRSAGQAIEPDTEIYLADTLGETGLFMRLADVVVMGGGFGRGIGGHNPLEPARLGLPVLAGPEVFNHAEVFAEMVAARAAIIVPDARTLCAVLAHLLAMPERRAGVGQAALAYAERQNGTLDAVLDLIAPPSPAP